MNSGKKMVLFGAGKIGRSFIGQLFSRGSYEVVFVDISRAIIDRLNVEKSYKVVIKSELPDQELEIRNVRGILLHNREEVIEELSTASIAALSVGQQGLPLAIPLIAEALEIRLSKMGNCPLDVIIAENMRNADAFISIELAKLLPDNFPLESMIGLVETSIGKMVPIMPMAIAESDPLLVYAERYNTLILDQKGFKNLIPDMEGLAPKDNMKAWVDRKLFIHNLGHATAAYLGFAKFPQAVYLYEVLADSEILDRTRATMLQSAQILIALYPGEFSTVQLTAHIDDLLSRFQNRALGDTIFRVGCDLFRKLSPDDRLVAPILSARKLQLPHDLILDALMAAISFRATDENGNFHPADTEFFKIAEQGFGKVWAEVCGI
jgi:mannitol-1-phosphate 5-dehydrogenase